MTLNVKFLCLMNLLGSINMSNYDLITFYLPQFHKWPPFKSSLSPLSSSSLTQHQVPKYAKQHIAMIFSDFRGLNSLFSSILPLKTNAVAIRDSIFHATTEAKQFSLSLIPGTSLCKVSVTQSNRWILTTQMAVFPDDSWPKTSLFPALLSSYQRLQRITPSTTAPRRGVMSIQHRFLALAATTLQSWWLLTLNRSYSSSVRK